MAKKKRPSGGPPGPDDDRVKFPFGESLDDDSGPLERPDPVKFPFGETVERPGADAAADDAVKFPFGETGERAGAQFGESLSDIGALDDSEIGVFDSGMDAHDSGGADLFGHSGSGDRLPSLPPGSRPGDDTSFEGLEEALVNASGLRDDASSEEEDDGPRFSPSELGEVPSGIGEIGPSGPLVIMEDEVDSTRFQASVIDDSMRVAGSKSVRRPPKRKAPQPKKRGKAAPPPELEQSRDWEDESVEEMVDVPTPSTRRSPSKRASRRSKALPPAAPSSRKGVALVALLGLLAVVGVGLFLEQRRRTDLRALDEQRGAEVQAAHDERRQALEQLEQSHATALAAERSQQEAAAQTQKTWIQKLETDLAAAEERAEAAESALKVERRRADEAEAALDEERRRAAATLEAELASARSEFDGTALAELEAEHTRVLEAERQEAADTKARLESDLSRARDQVAALKAELEEARLQAPTSPATSGGGNQGGSGESGGDDWNDFFEDSGSSNEGFDDFFDDNGDENASFEEPEDDGPNPVAAAWATFLEHTPVHGSLEYKNLLHFSHGLNGDAQKARNEVRLNVGFRDWLWQSSDRVSGVRLVAGVQVKYDDEDYTSDRVAQSAIDDEEDKRPIIVPDEIYLALSHDFFTFRAGYQKFGWGTGDLYNPTDNLNPIDYSDLFDPREIPVLSYTVGLDFEAFSLELVSVPTFTRTRLPLKGERFDILAASNVPVAVPDDPPSEFKNAQWGARAVVRQFGWDVSFSGYTGFDDVPVGQIAVQSVFPIVGSVVTEFNKVHVAGADFATTLGFLGLEGKFGELLAGIQLHGEAAHFWYEGERSDDFLQYVIGFNYQFIDILGETDLTLIVEYAGELETHKAEQPLPGTTLSRLFQSAWLARFVYDLTEDLSVAVNLAWIVHGPDGYFIHPECTYNVTDYFQVVLGGDIFAGSKNTFFGQFQNDGRFLGQARLLF